MKQLKQSKLLLTMQWKTLANLAKKIIDAIASDHRMVSTRKLPKPLLCPVATSFPSLERYYAEPSLAVFPSATQFLNEFLGATIGLDSSSGTSHQTSVSGEWWRVPLADQIRQAAERATSQLGWSAERLRVLVHQAENQSESALSLQELAGNAFLSKIKGGDFELFAEIRAVLVYLTSLVVYQKPIFFLYTEAKGGDDNALFALVTLDKAMAATEWAGLRITKASLENDAEFFRQFSTALSKDPLRTKRRQIRLAAFLFLFWPLGFQELRPAERFDFLEAAGFKAAEIPKEETLNRFLARCKFSEVWKGLSDELQHVIATLAVQSALDKRNKTHLKGPFV